MIYRFCKYQVQQPNTHTRIHLSFTFFLPFLLMNYKILIRGKGKNKHQSFSRVYRVFHNSASTQSFFAEWKGKRHLITFLYFSIFQAREHSRRKIHSHPSFSAKTKTGSFVIHQTYIAFFITMDVPACVYQAIHNTNVGTYMPWHLSKSRKYQFVSQMVTNEIVSLMNM